MGRVFKPYFVINFNLINRLQRSILCIVQWLFFRRGERRTNNPCSLLFWTIESIQPKHNASSTQSIYHSACWLLGLPFFIVTKHSFSVWQFFANHFRNCKRFVKRKILHSLQLIIYLTFTMSFLFNFVINFSLSKTLKKNC